MTDLGPAVQTVVRRCLGVKAGEQAVVVLDASLEVDGQPLLDSGRYGLDER